MTTVKRPTRSFSFSDWSKSRPREPHPGDRLDSMFNELVEAINSTQDALADVRRSDGGIKNNSIGREHILPDVLEELAKDLHRRVDFSINQLASAASNAQMAEQNSQLFAKDAEAAVKVATRLTSGIEAIRHLSEYSADVASKAAQSTDIDAIDAENWGNYSKAQADNAIAAKDEALQWAEFLAGPVVNSADAPAYIGDSKFPHGLYYQPVQGGVAGLWSAKWWALFAQQLVGKASVYYLGPWDGAPIPGEQNPNTGEMVPNPLAPGSIYYDTIEQTLKVWTGSEWVSPLALGQAFQSRFVYIATAGQTSFSGNDSTGHAPVVGTSPSLVYVNGVRLVEGSDFTVNATTSTLTIASPLTANSTVQWDLLVPPGTLAPGSVQAWKINPLTPNGTLQDFPLKYQKAGTATDANVGANAQLMVALDGAMQEPGTDYSASGNNLHMAVAPPADGHLWAVWYQPGAGP